MERYVDVGVEARWTDLADATELDGRSDNDHLLSATSLYWETGKTKECGRTSSRISAERSLRMANETIRGGQFLVLNDTLNVSITHPQT